MSNQAPATGIPAGVGACCSPLARAPLDALQAAEPARAFKALGDPVRLRLLSLIASHAGGEACVCELSDGFDVAGPTISHHLKVLRDAGLVTGERRGTWVYYRADPGALHRLSGVLATVEAPGQPPSRSAMSAATSAVRAGSRSTSTCS